LRRERGGAERQRDERGCGAERLGERDRQGRAAVVPTPLSGRAVLALWASAVSQARPANRTGPGTSTMAVGPDRARVVLFRAVPGPAPRARAKWPCISITLVCKLLTKFHYLTFNFHFGTMIADIFTGLLVHVCALGSHELMPCEINCIHVTLQSFNGTDLIIFFLVNCIVLCFVTILQSFSMISLVL
jgi:hypothetical protein